ncbi:MAG: PEGA domain-containing protein [Thiofilum sp.]|uniref:PEGA domain-containing protein n=1 Tax=Thiofilum sp. TaxID=2212733 RepID=UPI0025E89BE9|nr:PEGA domain-containing protein [Thiofilum sp.]MBK8454389.1 PEGA domain-containing protein [Thiofilum sp.]
MLKQLLSITTLVLLSIAFTGCATITRGTEEALVVESDPAGADVKLSNGMVGKTPTSFMVKRKTNLVVTVSKAGYQTATINVNSQIAQSGGAAMAGNIIFGGVIGAAVDSSNGATRELKPNPVKVKLNRL